MNVIVLDVLKHSDINSEARGTCLALKGRSNPEELKKAWPVKDKAWRDDNSSNKDRGLFRSTNYKMVVAWG